MRQTKFQWGLGARVWGSAAVGIAALAVIAAPGARADEAAEPVNFATDIWPFIESRCLSCHGDDRPKARLRFDAAEHFLSGGTSGPALVPGDPDASLIYERVVLPPDHDDIMPPQGDPLTAEQTALLRRWIAEGAEFGGWVFEKAEAPAGDVAPASTAIRAHQPGPAVASEFEQILARLAEGLEPLPADALAPLHELGALAMPLDQRTPLVRVSFQLLGDRVGDEQLALLAPLREHLTWLNLAGTKVTDAGLATFKDFPRLTMLHLERTGIGDAGLPHLAGLQHLEYLNLYATRVTDAGLAHLAGIPALRRLYCWQSAVTEEGAMQLAQANPALTIDLGVKAEPPAPAEEAPTEETAAEEAPAEEAPNEEAAAAPEA